MYRRLRNTLRYLLGALDGFTPDEAVAPAAMPELERWVLHRLATDRTVRQACADFEFHAIFTALHNFCESTCRPSTSTSARTRSPATGRIRRAAAPAAPSWTASSTA